MRKIYRYEVPVDGEVHVLKVFSDFGMVLRAEAPRDDLVEFWLEADDQHPGVEKSFTVVGTGHPLPDNAFVLGTTGRSPSGLVWHLCGIGRREPRMYEYPVGA